MDRYMLDSNIFDKLLDMRPQFSNTVELLITYEQLTEINKISDLSRKQQLLDMVSKYNLRSSIVTVALLGRMRLGQTALGSGETMQKLIKHNGSNLTDSIIGDCAVNHQCILVTEDKDLYKRMKNNSFAVMDFKEFIDSINAPDNR